MTIYKYRAKKDARESVEGRIEANSEKEAVEKINLLGYIPIEIKQESPTQLPSAGHLVKASPRLRSREITIFSRQLASLLKSGVPILRSLSIISEQSENRIFKSVLKNIHKDVEDGATFSSVLAQYPAIFSSLYIAMIHAGEDSGALPEVLLKIADYRTKQEDMISRIRMAMAYPILMACVGLGTVIFMLSFVMPRLTNLYRDMQQALPLPTKILLSISKGLQHWWFWIYLFLIMFFSVLIINRYLRTKTGKIAFSIFQLHIPLIGTLILKAELARFSRTLGLLLRSGIPILKAITITIPVLGNELIKSQLYTSFKDLEQGGSLGRSLKNSKIIPIFMSNLIIVGEESGKLDEALTESADSYERDTDEAIRVMGSLLEPLMILGMGLIVGFIVVAMLLPVFEINVMVR